jgi:glycosyltransferase involved in cell wall biosynthesis
MTLELEGAAISRPLSIPCGAIDIGLIVYNERDLIGPTLAALLAAGFDRFVVLDMQSTDGTVEYIRETLGDRAHIVSFPRRSLIEYGYAEARNTCASFSTREWLLFVDADEVLIGGVENGSVILKNQGETPNIYSIKRNNLERDPENGPGAVKIYSVENHNRLYKPSFRLRYAGYIHEALCLSGQPCYNTSGQTALVFDHYSQLKKSDVLEQKESLYSMMLLRVYNQPDIRGGTTAWWYDTFVPERIAAITARATAFAREQGFEPSFYSQSSHAAASCTPESASEQTDRADALARQPDVTSPIASPSSPTAKLYRRLQSMISPLVAGGAAAGRKIK